VTVQLSPAFEKLVLESLGGRTPPPSQILALSNFYLEHPGKPTPWETGFAVPATLAYFMPLNYARMSAALREVARFALSPSEVWDFGSGAGTTQWALEDLPDFAPRPLYSVEISQAARDMHKKLEPLRAGGWRSLNGSSAKPAPGAMAIFSYSFLEMQNVLPDLKKFEHILIVEPSTRDCGRALMEWRSRFLEQGLTALAPCTHQQACPLLVHSPRDWCHMRVHFDAPEWWRAIESHLPMKNRTLTYSYLLLSRSEDQKWAGSTRVIGDTLHEKGKTRQMICRGPEREFLSWLHRDGDAPDIPHGALIRDLGPAEAKGHEIRAGRDLKWIE
jgi:ribosomal protein RSM22 (predicted rRNA methylase)